MKKIFTITIFVFLFLLFVGWFYWTNIRVEKIRKVCYSEAFRQNEENFEWAEGKNWTYLAAFADGPHGWVYPDYKTARATVYDAVSMMKKDQYDEKAIIVQTMEKVNKMRDEVYRQCLVREGISTSL